MKKTLTSIKRLLTCLGLLTGLSASAQVSLYTFSQAAGTYTAVTGGTVIASNSMGNMDDEVFGPITIPAFAFDGAVYTSIYINTNGHITFGSASSATNYLALSGTETYAGAISAFSQDLDVAASGTRNIRAQLIGSEFVVQWQNVSRYGLSDRISFQVRLNTSDNVIKIVYGGTITPDNDNNYPEVGLRGPDNSFPANINNRRVNAATGSWVNSIAGTNNTSTCYFNSATATTVPAAGLTYTWTPPALNAKAETIALPLTSGCYGRAETVSATIRNVGSAPINFATSPVTVNATAAGTNPATFAPVTINSGTLAVNASQNVQITTTYDMSVHGAYTFDFTASITGDLQTSNDHAVEVRNSHTPTVAYSDVAGCSGQDLSLLGTATAYNYVASTTNSTPLSIPDDTPAGVNSTIVISGAGTTPASAVTATINNLTHTYDGDLVITLIAPDGSSVILSNGEGSDADFISTEFSDAATIPISAGDSPFTGSFNPESPFSGLTGLANGTWTLNIADIAAVDVGTLNSWTLSFNVTNSITTYSWSPATDLNSATAANPIASPALSTLYIVTATDVSGCANTDSVQVTMNALPAVTATATATAVCSGASVTLSGNGAGTYTWTGGITDAVPFTPSATDTYTVTGTDANGCTNTAMVTVTVNALPTVTAASDVTGDAVCDGSSVTLSGSGANTYSWTGGVTDGVAFTPTVTDTYTVTGTDANGCEAAAMITVTVNALPGVTATASAAGVCDGSSVTLTGDGAATYTWTGGVTDGVAFTPTVTDTYTVTGTDANGCVSTGMITVTVYAIPTVGGSADASTVCAGSPVTLTGSGAATYTWTGGVTDGVAFMPVSTDTYTVTGTDGNGCTNTASVTVTVNALPSVDLALTTTSACIGNGAITLGGGSPAGGTWSGTGVSGSTFDPAVAGAGSTVITYMYTDVNGCSANDTASIFVDLCTGIAAVASNDMQLNAYPNPANSTVTLTIVNAGAEAIQLQMINVLGKEVYNEQVYAAGTELTAQIDVSSFAKGTYLLRVNTGKTLKVLKIVKQ